MQTMTLVGLHDVAGQFSSNHGGAEDDWTSAGLESMTHVRASRSRTARRRVAPCGYASGVTVAMGAVSGQARVGIDEDVEAALDRWLAAADVREANRASGRAVDVTADAARGAAPLAAEARAANGSRDRTTRAIGSTQAVLVAKAGAAAGGAARAACMAGYASDVEVALAGNVQGSADVLRSAWNAREPDPARPSQPVEPTPTMTVALDADSIAQASKLVSQLMRLATRLGPLDHERGRGTIRAIDVGWK